MFKEKFQGKLISVYYSVGSHPLADWLVQCKKDELCTVQDDEIKSKVLQIQSPNVVASLITTPIDPRGSLNIRLPHLTLQIKNLAQSLTFEVTVLDSKKIRRRIRASSYLKASRTSTFESSMPLPLSEGWNQVQFNLAQFTERVYGTSYTETLRVSVHANCRLRRVYFSDRLYANDELPDAFQLYKPARVRAKPTKMVYAKKSSAKEASAKEVSTKEASVTGVTQVVIAAAEATSMRALTI